MHTNTKLMETNAGHNHPLYFLRGNPDTDKISNRDFFVLDNCFLVN